MASIPMDSGATVPSDEEIDEALEVIRKANSDLYDQAIEKWNALDAEGNREGLNNLARSIVMKAGQILRQERSAPMPKAAKAPAVPAPPREGTVSEASRRVLGFAAFWIGAPLWVSGAHYQLDGATLLANSVLELIRVDYRFPLATNAWVLLLIIFGVVFSIGERRYLPFKKIAGKERPFLRRYQFRGIDLLVVWALVNGLDLLGAYLGIAQTPKPDAWPVTILVATQWQATIVWMGIVVYIGDWLISLGWKWMGLPNPFGWLIRMK